MLGILINTTTIMIIHTLQVRTRRIRVFGSRGLGCMSTWGWLLGRALEAMYSTRRRRLLRNTEHIWCVLRSIEQTDG